MGNIYEFPDDDLPPRSEPAPEPIMRSKHRQALSQFDLVRGKRSLSALVDRAFETLDEAMISAEHATAIKAALGVLDRAGFGPKSTLDVNQTTVDLTALSRIQLAERALKIHQMIKEREDRKTLPASQSTIDVTPTKSTVEHRPSVDTPEREANP